MNKAKAPILVALVLIAIVSGLYISSNWPYWSLERQVAKMKTANDIEQAFGKPRYTFFRGAQDYYIDGYSYESRDINGRVEVYFPTMAGAEHYDVILYVYYAGTGEIEGFYVGGS